MTLEIAMYVTSEVSKVEDAGDVIELESRKDGKVVAISEDSRSGQTGDIAEKRDKRGGKRAGSGQPAKYGVKTKAVRLPENLVTSQKDIDLILAIPKLQALLAQLEQDCNDKPGSSRHDQLRKALKKIRELGY